MLINAPPCQLEASPADEPVSGAMGLSIERLVEKHLNDVFRYAFRFSGNVADAEDLTQQCFLLAQRHVNQLRDPSRAGPWLMSIVRNSFFKLKRRQRPQSASTHDLNMDGFPDLSDQGASSEPGSLQFALDQLDSNHRQIILMYYFEDLSYQQIAEKLNVKMGTVMSRLSRAKSSLREILSAQSRFEETER